MNSIPTRFFCAVLSMVGTVGLVAFSTPAVAIRGHASSASAPVVIAAAPLSVTLRG